MSTPLHRTRKCICASSRSKNNSSVEERLAINTCFVAVNISRHGGKMMVQARGENDRRRRRWGHLDSVTEKSSNGMNTLVYSFGTAIFSQVGLWLLERRCRLALSQKESIFLPLLHFSRSAFFLQFNIFSKTPLCAQA